MSCMSETGCDDFIRKDAVDTDMDKMDDIVQEIRVIKPDLAESLAALTVDFE